VVPSDLRDFSPISGRSGVGPFLVNPARHPNDSIQLLYTELKRE